MAHLVKDLALSLLWCKLDPRARNFGMLQAQPKKKYYIVLFNIFLLKYS